MSLDIYIREGASGGDDLKPGELPAKGPLIIKKSEKSACKYGRCGSESFFKRNL